MSGEIDIKKMIRDEIRLQMDIILSGETGDADNISETIQNLYPGMPGITGRPTAHPYGFCSLAPDGTIQVTARQGENQANRLVLGHRAADRPADLKNGEAAVYSVGKYMVRIQNDMIQIGKDGVYEPVLMGETSRQFFISLIQLILVHTHEDGTGIETSVPLNAEDFTQLQSDNLDNSKVLAEDGGRF